MNSVDYNYIWQASDWPHWRLDLAALAGSMAEVSRAHGLLMGRLTDVGMALQGWSGPTYSGISGNYAASGKVRQIMSF